MSAASTATAASGPEAVPDPMALSGAWAEHQVRRGAVELRTSTQLERSPPVAHREGGPPASHLVRDQHRDSARPVPGCAMKERNPLLSPCVIGSGGGTRRVGQMTPVFFAGVGVGYGSPAHVHMIDNLITLWIISWRDIPGRWRELGTS